MIDRTNKYYLTTAEMLVMRAIWLADHDLVLNEVVRDCNAAYGKDWKPQTVSTYLSHYGWIVMERSTVIIRL